MLTPHFEISTIHHGNDDATNVNVKKKLLRACSIV